MSAPLAGHTLTYLGGKQRFLDEIIDTISKNVPQRATVCDLFSGSGAVSFALAKRWSVTAIDIQEYARVLSSAALSPEASGADVKRLIGRVQRSTLRQQLDEAFWELLRRESTALDAAERGDPEPLCQLIDYGSLVMDESPDQRSRAVELCRKRTQSHIERRGLDTGPQTVISRYYGGVYFSWKQAIQLDSLLMEVHKASQPHKDLLLAAVFGAATDAVNSVGKHFAQPLRLRNGAGQVKEHLVRQTIRDRRVDVFERFLEWVRRLGANRPPPGDHVAIRSDFADFLADSSCEVDLVYADPPYTRDHYSRFYHVLETMALRDEPNLSTTSIRSDNGARISRGIYRDDRHQSPFCIKSKAEAAFDELISLVSGRDAPLVLSYSPYAEVAGNRPRLMTIDRLVEIMGSYYGEVRLREAGVRAHNKFNRNERNIAVYYPAEVLLIGS